ncbi:MBL fold metallo-hydrolase [Acidimicrobiales bacterium]|jgi:glyoxylase-like metal-dependent hydrolase (beta-lactamase superfamily II)/rhodanese-related sulfurtransferase|nr:MBL fold metallo-hydrolase [Acidimicrobiales bacterium]
MIFTQYYLECLSQASYLIGDETTGRAVVVDPRRDINEYVQDAEAAGLTIELILETHFHADFLSGHLELANATGAIIGLSDVASPEFDVRPFADGEKYSLGDIELEILQTPGHTPESISIVVREQPGKEPWGVLTGDTLFIGDVGRPDLLASIGYERDELADMLYDSLHNKLMPLPDATRVYPAHGAGSACGKNLSTETSSTMGQQRAENYALLAPDKQTFIDMVTEGQPPVPGYFAYDAILNRKDRELLDENSSIDALSLTRAEALVAGGAMLVDGRGPDEFGNGHLAGSVNVGLDGRYAEFAGSVVPGDVDIVLLVDEGRELEARNRLARIGFDRVVGYLESPHQVMIDNPEKVQQASRLTAGELAGRFESIDDLQLIDIRNPGEFALGAIDGAAAMPVGQMPGRLGEIDPAKSTVVYCAGGYRSSVAASYLRSHGFEDVSDLLGGYGAWVQALA